MAMDLDDLRDRLREARDSISTASSSMDDIKSNANYAENEADDAYSKIDDILDNLDAYLAIDVDQHRTMLALNQRLAKIFSYLNVLLRDSARGDGVNAEDERRLYQISNILESLFLFSVGGDHVVSVNPYYDVEYGYSDYSWTIKKKEANNG